MRVNWALLRDGEGEGGGGGGESSLPPPPSGGGGGGEDVNAQIQRMQAEIGALRGAVQSRTVEPPPPPPPPSSAVPGKKELEEAFWKDPLTLSAAIAQKAALDAVQAHGAVGMETLIEMAKQQARGTDPEKQKLFDAYLSEIEGVVQAMPPQLQTNKNVWQNAAHVVYGRHVEDIRKMTAPSTPSGSSGGPLPPSTRAPRAPEKTPLSAEEKVWAERWGLTEDGYRHGKELYEGQDTAFDSVITFDSREARRRERAERDKRRGAA